MSTITERLAGIAATIDRDLEDETRSRQQIAEEAAQRIRQIIRTLSRAKDPQPATPADDREYGPFDDDRLAAAASSWAREGRPHGRRQDLGERDVTSACHRAGVALGTYDARVLRWLADFGPEYTSVVAGLITRASAAAVIDSATVRRALADAAAYSLRQVQECPECRGEPGMPHCDSCADHLSWRHEYKTLLARMARKTGDAQ